MITNEPTTIEGEVIGLDVGEKRIGVARINTAARLAEPLAPLQAGDGVQREIAQVAVDQGAAAVVVGLPRGLDGQETQQTTVCREFATSLAQAMPLPVYLIDEAGTSREAALRIENGQKGSLDSVAAMIILEDFINQPDHQLYKVRLSA